MNILFWNMNGKSLDECLKEIAVENNCDFIILAEYPGDIHFICKYLNMYIQDEYCVVPNNGGCNRIKAMIKSSYKTESISEQGRYQIIRIQTVYYQLIVAMMHNISKHQSTDREQEEKLREMNNDILQNENIHKTRNVLIVGDLNMNPFEEACVAANTIHGIPFKEELKKEGRKVRGHIYREFYNPMWKFLGREKTPFGTCFYNRSELVNYFWNIFDQFLIRPELLEALDEDSLHIITNTSKRTLLKEDGKPDNKHYSDHLPIFVRIEEGEIK